MWLHIISNDIINKFAQIVEKLGSRVAVDKGPRSGGVLNAQSGGQRLGTSRTTGESSGSNGPCC